MKIKTVSTVLTTNSAGQVVESLPVREVTGPQQNGAGQWVDPVSAEKAPDGIPVRFVSGSVALNSVGHPVAALPIRGAPSWLTAIDPAAVGGIDFANNRSYGMGYDFARASSGYQLNASGVWTSFAAGVLRRIDGVGALIEPERINLVVLNTGNSGAGITLTGTTLAAWGGTDSPALDAHAKRVTQGAGATDGVTRHTLNTLADTYYVASQSFKYDGSATWARFVVSDNVAHGFQAWLNLQTMSVGTANVFGSGTLLVAGLVAENNGWHRLWMVGKTPNAANSGMTTHAATGNGINTRAAGTFGIWGAGFSLGQVVNSPILTFGTAVTRSADDLDLTNFAGTKLRFTFDNDTTQEVSAIAAPHQVPVNLNRSVIKNVIALAA